MGSPTVNPDKKNLRKQAKIVKQKDHRICRKRMEKTTREKKTVQLQEINQKVLANAANWHRRSTSTRLGRQSDPLGDVQEI